MAPETLYSPDGSSDYTDAIDIWAVGCIACRLVSGSVPFTILALVQYCQDKSTFPLDPLFDCGIKSEGSKFLRHLLITEPKDRPSASQALQHEWILSSEFYKYFLCYFSRSLVYVPVHSLLPLLIT